MIASFTVDRLATAVRRGENSAREVVTESLRRIELAQPKLNAFIRVDPDRSLAEADHIDRVRHRGDALGPLAGVPIAVKDNICTSFGTTTCGCTLLVGFHSQYDAFVVERLRQAGAVIVGKTNMDEFAMGSSTENSAFGPTRNPWGLDRVPGGSSGGSAAAVAARLVPAALGSDTGGSVRQPAGLCGVVGLKPTYGLVSRYGLVAYASSLDQIGPITTDARDAALLLDVIAGHDSRDSTSLNAASPDCIHALEKPLQGLRLGIAPEYFAEGLDSTVRRRVEEAVELLRAQGATVHCIALPHMKYGIAAYYLIAAAEASSNLARFDGVRFGRRSPNASDVASMYADSRSEGFSPEVMRRIMLGTFALSAGYHDAFYLKASKVRTLIRRDFDQAFRGVDAVVSPVSPTTAFSIGQKIDDPLTMYLSDVYTIAANLAGLCAISLPCGFDEAGLPVGLQLMGPPFADGMLLNVAHRFQEFTDFHRRIPPDFAGNEG